MYAQVMVVGLRVIIVKEAQTSLQIMKLIIDKQMRGVHIVVHLRVMVQRFVQGALLFLQIIYSKVELEIQCVAEAISLLVLQMYLQGHEIK